MSDGLAVLVARGVRVRVGRGVGVALGAAVLVGLAVFVGGRGVRVAGTSVGGISVGGRSVGGCAVGLAAGVGVVIANAGVDALTARVNRKTLSAAIRSTRMEITLNTSTECADYSIHRTGEWRMIHSS